MYEIDKINYLQIGVQGENIARKIEIDMTKWVEELEADHVSGYTFGLIFKPYNDPNKYPMVTTYDEETHVLTWRVSAAATQTPGVGYAEVRAQEATSGLVRKTRIIPTAVEDSVSGNETEPPASQEEWVTAVLNSAAAVLALAQGKQVKFEIDEDTGHLMLCYSDDEEVTVDTEWTTVDLGAVNAYAMAVLAGYTGTAAQFEQYMADIANGASAAAASAIDAAASAAEARQYTVDEIDDWLGDHITNPSNPPLDTSLSLSNAAAPANQVGSIAKSMCNLFDDVLWQLVYIDTTDGVTWTSNNKYLTCLKIPTTAGQILYIGGNSTYGSRVMVYFYDTESNFLNVSEEYVRNTNESTSVTIAQDGYIRVRFQSYSQNTLTDELQAIYKAMPVLYVSVKSLIDKIDENAENITNNTDAIEQNTENIERNALLIADNKTAINTIFDVVLQKINTTLTGVIQKGFYNTGNNTFTESNNFDTLIVEYDETAHTYLFSGNVPNQLTAGATFLNSSDAVISYALQGTSAGNINYTDKSIGEIPQGTKKIAFTTYNQLKALTVKKQKYGNIYSAKKMVIQGDSIETESAGKWPVMLKNAITFGSYTNCAVGGTCIAAVGSNYISSDARMALMPETADIVLVGGGTNDWGNNVPMGTLDDLSSNANFAGAVYSLITKLQTKYPSAYIVFMSNQTGCSPNRTGFDDPSGWINNLGYTMSDYAEMLHDVCKFAAIPFIDVNHECGINRLNYTLYNLQETNQNNDTVYVHPNEAGAKRMFQVIYNWFRNNAPTE